MGEKEGIALWETLVREAAHVRLLPGELVLATHSLREKHSVYVTLDFLFFLNIRIYGVKILVYLPHHIPTYMTFITPVTGSKALRNIKIDHQKRDFCTFFCLFGTKCVNTQSFLN